MLSLFCSSALLYSQVRIKEKVIINPTTQTKLNLRTELSTLYTHSVRVQVSMSSNVFCYYVAWENKTYCYPGTGTARIIPPGSSIAVTVQGGEATFDLEGTYQYTITWTDPYGGASCGQSADIKVFLDNNLIFSRSVNNACSTWGSFIVAFPKCGPECTTSSPPVAPSFTFSPATDDKYCGQDFGYTAYDKNEIFNNYQIELCYNSSLDQWIIKLNNSNKAVFKYYSGLCENKMNSYPFVVRNINDINNLPPNEICRAKSDFETTYQYPLHGGTYIFRELIEGHEKGHESDIQNLFKNLFDNQYKFGDQFLAFKLKCEQTNGFNDAKNKAETFTKNLIDSFRDTFDKEFTRLYGNSKNSNHDLYNRWYTYEKDIQRKAYDIVWEKYKRIFDRCSK